MTTTRLSFYADQPIVASVGDSDCVPLAVRVDDTGKTWRYLRLAGGANLILGGRDSVVRPGDEGQYFELLEAWLLGRRAL